MADLIERRSPRAAREGAAPPGEALRHVAASLRHARTVEDAMGVLVLEAQAIFGAASAVAYVLRGETLEFVAAMGRAEDADEWLPAIPVGASIPVARATREGAPGWYESRAALAAAFPGWARRVPHAARFGALVSLPLRAGGGATLGAIGFAFDDEREFGPAERAALVAVAAEGALAVDRVRRLAEGESPGAMSGAP